MRKFLTLLILLSFPLALAGCSEALQRGLMGQSYISTARPSITLGVKNMPLLTGGQGMASLENTGMLGGLTVDVWLAAYGEGGLSPLAIVAQAQLPQGWYWDGILQSPFSVDQGAETFNGVSYQAWTYVIDPADDAFGALVTGVKPDGSPQKWMVRAYAARYNFNQDKIILQYREPLPEGIESLSSLPLGQGDLLIAFAQRARDAFQVSDGPKDPSGVTDPYANDIRWKYMGQDFLGSASQYPVLNR